MREMIKRFYDLGIYSEEQIIQLVIVNAININDYTYITNKPYLSKE